MIDLIIVRAHQHSAGPLIKKGGATAQAIGHSRCGLTTKVLAVACENDGAITVDVFARAFPVTHRG